MFDAIGKVVQFGLSVTQRLRLAAQDAFSRVLDALAQFVDIGPSRQFHLASLGEETAIQ